VDETNRANGSAGSSRAFDASSSDLDKQLVSKNWKERSDAFENLKTMMEEIYSQESHEIPELLHESKWSSYLTDSNPGVIDKAYDCFLIYIKNYTRSLSEAQMISNYKL
jgi:hypothetical protein